MSDVRYVTSEGSKRVRGGGGGSDAPSERPENGVRRVLKTSPGANNGPELTRLADNPLYRRLLKLDREAYQLQKDIAAELGDGVETAELLLDARERLWDATHQLASDTRPRVTSYIRNAARRAADRRA